MLGDVESVTQFVEMLSQKNVHKRLAVVSLESSDDRRAVFVNRVLSVETDTHPRGIVYEPHARHG